MLSVSFFLSDGKIISSYRAQIFKYSRQCKARIYDGGSNRRRSKWKIIQPCDRYVPLSRYRQSADSKIVVVPRIIPDPSIALVFLGIRIPNRYSVRLFFSYPPPFFARSFSIAFLLISFLVRSDRLQLVISI